MPVLILKDNAHMLGELGKTIAKFFGFDSSSPSADILLQNGDNMKFGRVTLKVMHTPGHSP